MERLSGVIFEEVLEALNSDNNKSSRDHNFDNQCNIRQEPKINRRAILFFKYSKKGTALVTHDRILQYKIQRYIFINRDVIKRTTIRKSEHKSTPTDNYYNLRKVQTYS
jgi:hypothetical protein